MANVKISGNLTTSRFGQKTGLTAATAPGMGYPINSTFANQAGSTFFFPTQDPNKRFCVLSGAVYISDKGGATINLGVTMENASYGVGIVSGSGSPSDEWRNAVYIRRKTTTSFRIESVTDEGQTFNFVVTGIVNV